MTPEEFLEHRRSTLLRRTSDARLRLDSLSSLDSSYRTCREDLRQWRVKLLAEIDQAHQSSLTDLTRTYEQLNHIRATVDTLAQQASSSSELESHLDLLRHAEFTFDFTRANQLEGRLELVKLCKPSSSRRRTVDPSSIRCRLLVPRDRAVSNPSISKIDCQTSECLLICPLECLYELIVNENELRLLIDQSYLPAIRSQTQRMLSEHDLVLLQPAQESCPQSTERVMKIIGHDPTKIFACVEDLLSICSQQGQDEREVLFSLYSLDLCSEPLSNSIPYNPQHCNRSKVHLYGGYSDPPLSIPSAPSSFFPSPVVVAAAAASTSEQHFDRVLMPVPSHRTLSITDTQAGALLGPKGERIRQLQRETGAIVTIGDVNEESSEQRRKRIVYIQGNEQQVNSANQAIQRLLAISHEEAEKVRKTVI